MTFLTGTMFDGNPGGLYYGIIENAMVAQGWVLVDTVVIGANTHKVLKSAAVGNSRNQDWYMDINYPTAGTVGGMRFSAFEDYTVATHLGIRGPAGYNANLNTIEATYYSAFGATGKTLEDNAWANNANYPKISLTLSAISHKYYISVTRDRIIMMVSSDGGNINYCGFYQPSADYASYVGGAMYPLVTLKATGYGASSAGGLSSHSMTVTRLPKVVTNFGGWGTTCEIYADYTLTIFGSGILGNATSQFTGKIIAVPFVIKFKYGTGDFGSFTGVINDLGFAWVVNTILPGDTVTIAGETWYLGTPLSSGFTKSFLMRGV